MVLRVQFDEFDEAVKRYAPGAPVFTQQMAGGMSATAVNPKTDVIISTVCTHSLTHGQELLRRAGLTVSEGEWTSDEEEGLSGVAAMHIAAVAYRSSETAPGLWVEAFAYPPTQGDVLKRMYDEFVAQGELKAVVPLEEFIRLAHPTLVILDPSELENLLGRHKARS